ncbi:MAG: hypothetical protein JW866_00055 [Ignavibacteriales bacterium]|nr:hypothetical protein [Ignavibacteriales bacterium]
MSITTYPIQGKSSENQKESKIELGLEMSPSATGKPLKLKHAPEMIEDLKKTEEIEKVAWELFLMKLRLSFRRELTPEEKKSITDTEDYKYYRDEALKIWEKKQRALNNKKYPVIEVPASGKRTRMGGAYCLCFVYSKYNGNFVLKGYMKEVEEYLKKNYTHYFYNLSLWYRGFNRDIWHFWKKDIGIWHPSVREKRKGKKIEVRPYSDWFEEDVTTEEKKKMALHFKRMPKRWIPEFDKF